MKAIMTLTDRFMTRHFTRPSITWRESMAIILPLIAENLFNTFFGMINMSLISGSGTTSLSAVSLVDSLTLFLFVFFTGVATGAGVVVANYRGKGEKNRLHDSMVQAVTAVTLLTVLTAVLVVLFHRPLLQILFGAAEQDVMDKARLYLVGSVVTLPIHGIVVAICGVLRSIGEGKTALTYTVISTIVYVLLNTLFIEVLQMGVLGLVVSLCVVRVANILLLLFLLKTTRSGFRARFREFFHVDFSMLGNILRIGMPCAMEQLFFNGGRLVTQSIVVPMGTNAIVTYNISYSIMTLSQSLVNPVDSAMFTVSGVCMGKNRPEDVRSLTKSYFWFNTASYVLSAGIIVWVYPLLARMYNAPAELVSEIFLFSMIPVIAQPILHNAGFLLPSVFRAVGDGVYTTVVSLAIMWILRVFGGLVLGTWLGLGVLGIWIATILDWVARAILFPLRFRGTKWLQHRFIEN